MGNENIIRNEAEIVFSKLIFSREFIIQQASIQPKKNKLNQLKESSGKNEILSKLLTEISDLENRKTVELIH